jgi:predicted acyltransferase
MLKPDRIQSVDFLRGLTVAGMILVNDPGSWEYIYSPLKHAEWNGCTPTDLIFPFFLFIVGISITYALKSVKSNPQQAYGKLAKRTALLFLFGFFLNLFPEFDFSTVRILGVLQRISLVFLISAWCFLQLNKKQILWTGGAILVLYWVLMCFVPNPAFATGMLEPGKNIGAWIDSLLLPGHMWKFTETWDPEGVLSTLPAIATGLSGVLTGLWLQSQADTHRKLIELFVVGCYLILAGLIWSLQFPINKSLWTSSYVLYTSGIALLLLGLVYWRIDIQQNHRYTKPFLVFGSNAIAVYMLSEILADVVVTIHIQGKSLKEIIVNTISVDFIPKEFSSLLFALLWLGMIYIPALILYRKKIFLKV